MRIGKNTPYTTAAPESLDVSIRRVVYVFGDFFLCPILWYSKMYLSLYPNFA